MNLFNLIGQYNKNIGSTYGDILNENSSIDNKLTKTERELYNQLKFGDIQRFKMNENKKLIDNNYTKSLSVQDISGIGQVTQIC